MVSTWKDEKKVNEYVGRVGRLVERTDGEAELIEALPQRCERVLDLGCGDGRLIRVTMDARPSVTTAIGLDNSAPMVRRARERFGDDPRVTIEEHDLESVLGELGTFDAIVSGFAIHHLPHARKQTLFSEVASLLRPGGVFANLEVVQCATPELQEAFYRRIDRDGGDPEDVLAGVEQQLVWMRNAGLVQVDCFWRWRGFALLVGESPADARARSG